MIYIYGINVREMCDKLNCDLDNIFKWLCNNKLGVNKSKCKYMFLGSKYNITKTNNATIRFDCVILDRVNKIKYLGVIIDEQ